MSEKQIIEGKIGSEAKYDVDFVDGDIIAKITYDGSQADVSLEVKLGLIEMLKIAAAKSENKIDDAIVNMVEAALK